MQEMMQNGGGPGGMRVKYYVIEYKSNNIIEGDNDQCRLFIFT